MPLPTNASNISADYGGPYVNQRPTEDVASEMDASLGNQELCDVGMMTHTSRRAWVLWTGITYTSGTMTIIPDDHEAQWGSESDVRPTIQQTSAGIWIATWPTNVDDQLGTSRPLLIRFPEAPVVYGADTLRAKIISWTANTVTLNSTSGGALNALNGTKIGFGWS